MSPQLSKKPVIARDRLERLVSARLKEASALFESGLFSGVVYLGGYAVECQLKATICKTLKLDELPETFKTHDLELLMLHSGVQSILDESTDVSSNFRKICQFWGRTLEVRYRDPDGVSGEDAKYFMQWVNGTGSGVVPWLQEVV